MIEEIIIINLNATPNGKIRSKKKIVGIVTKALDGNYNNIKKVDLKFNVKKLKVDIEEKTDVFLKKSFT